MEFVGGESWPIQCCARNVKARFMANVQKIKRTAAKLAMHFVCSKCKGKMEETVDSIEELCNKVETVKEFCYLGDRLNANGSCEPAVTARVRLVE